MQSQQYHKDRLQELLIKTGGVLQEAPTGPVLERFDPLRLAQGIEHELARLQGLPFRKIRLDMNDRDAAALAAFLRRAAGMGT